MSDIKEFDTTIRGKLTIQHSRLKYAVGMDQSWSVVLSIALLMLVGVKLISVIMGHEGTIGYQIPAIMAGIFLVYCYIKKSNAKDEVYKQQHEMDELIKRVKN